MNTTEAATRANVTTATIRTWARIGAVAAVKTSGKWDIDEASLTHRIALTAKPAAPKPLTVENLVAIGGKRWQKGDMDRIYFNDWAEFAGLKVSHYNTGNISSAAYQGEDISNSQAYKLLGSINKLWFDVADGQFRAYLNTTSCRVATPKDVLNAAVAGIRNAVNAL